MKLLLHLIAIIVILHLVGGTTSALYLQSENSSNPLTPPTTLGLIHPTILGATVRNNCTNKQCGIIINTRPAAYEISIGEEGKKIRNVKPFSMPENFGINASYGAGFVREDQEIKFDELREYAKENFHLIFDNGSNSSALLNSSSTCIMEIPSAFERFVYKNTPYFIGIHETHMCLVRLKDINPGTQGIIEELRAVRSDTKAFTRLPVVLSPFTFTKYPTEYPLPKPENYYRITAITVLPPEESNSDYANFITFDETGRVGYFQLDLDSLQKNTSILRKSIELKLNHTWSLSDVYFLHKDEQEIDIHPWNHNLSAVMENEITPNGSMIMREHFDLAFIEGITLYKEALCFSRGWVIQSHYPIRCLNGFKLLSEPMYSVFYRLIVQTHRAFDYDVPMAFEIIEYGDTSVYHAAIQNIQSNTEEPRFNPIYLFCPFKVVEKGLNCYQYTIQRVPIDFVHIHTPKCNYLATFYPFWYQVNHVNESVFEFGGKKVFAPWMTFDAKAIMAQYNKLYFFLSGNIVLTYDFNPDICDSIEIDISSARYFLASELLRLFGETYHKTYVNDSFADYKFKAGPPYYTGFTQRLDGKWSPPLMSRTKLVEIDEYTQLSANPWDKIRNGDGTSKLAFIILILIVLVLLICILYWIYFSKSGQDYEVTELKRLTNSKRKVKIDETKVVNGQQVESGLQSKQGSRIKSSLSSGHKSTHTARSSKVGFVPTDGAKSPSSPIQKSTQSGSKITSSPPSKESRANTKLKTRSKSPLSKNSKKSKSKKSSARSPMGGK